MNNEPFKVINLPLATHPIANVFRYYPQQAKFSEYYKQSEQTLNSVDKQPRCEKSKRHSVVNGLEKQFTERSENLTQKNLLSFNGMFFSPPLNSGLVNLLAISGASWGTRPLSIKRINTLRKLLESAAKHALVNDETNKLNQSFIVEIQICGTSDRFVLQAQSGFYTLNIETCSKQFAAHLKDGVLELRQNFLEITARDLIISIDSDIYQQSR